MELLVYNKLKWKYVNNLIIKKNLVQQYVQLKSYQICGYKKIHGTFSFKNVLWHYFLGYFCRDNDNVSE